MPDRGWLANAAVIMSAKVRLALFIAAIFAMFGIMLPYWPVWLVARGLTAEQIGIVLGAGILARVITTPLVTAWADRHGERKRLIVALAGLGLVGTLCYLPAQGFWWILLIALPVGGCLNATVSLVDSLTLMAARRDQFAYSRVRLWGSVSFLVLAVITGRWLTDHDADWLLWGMLGLLGVTVLVATALPDLREPGRAGRLFNLLPLLRSRPLMLMFLSAGLIQGSHHFYYGFSTLHWRAGGLSETLIGALWAEGVVAEILLFWLAPKLGRLGGAVPLLVVGGLGGAIRWGVTAWTAEPWALVAVQGLHALSFAATHLGAMQILSRDAPVGLSASAQGLYSALALGIGGAAISLLAGVLYGRLGGDAFLAAAALCLIGGLAALWLRHSVAHSGPHSDQI